MPLLLILRFHLPGALPRPPAPTSYCSTPPWGDLCHRCRLKQNPPPPRTLFCRGATVTTALAPPNMFVIGLEKCRVFVHYSRVRMGQAIPFSRAGAALKWSVEMGLAMRDYMHTDPRAHRQKHTYTQTQTVQTRHQFLHFTYPATFLLMVSFYEAWWSIDWTLAEVRWWTLVVLF